MTAQSKFAPKASSTQARASKPKAPRANVNEDAMTRFAEDTAKAREALYEASDVPSHARMLITSLTQLVAFSGAFYGAIQLTGLLVVAATTFTGMAFIGVCAALIGGLLAFRFAWRVGTVCADIALNFEFSDVANLGRDVKLAAQRRVSLVRGWFRRVEADEAVADPIAV